MDIKSLLVKAKKVCQRMFRKAVGVAKKAAAFVRTHKIITAAVAGVTVMVMLMSMVLIRRREVVIYIDNVETASFSTLKQEPQEWLAHAKVTVFDGDQMRVDGSQVYIDRAFFVTVKADGVETSFKTVSCLASEAVAKAEISVGENDIMSVAADTVLTQDTVIEIARVATDTLTKTETIKFETIKKETDKLYKGETEVETKGENGKKEYVYQITLTDGVETDRKLISETVVKEPVDKVVLVGTKEKPKVTTSSTPTSYKAVYQMNASAYTFGEDGGNSTATGIRPYKGVVAVDPKVIPLGTKLYIETSDGKYVYGEAIAADTGGSIKGYKIDLFLDTKSEVRKFGRRTVNVYVLN